MSTQKSYQEVVKELAKLQSTLRQKSIRITLITLSRVKEKSRTLRQVENNFYKELAKPIRNNNEVDNLIEELWELAPPTNEVFRLADKD